MAKLRIFVSSTYYDLRHIRNSLEQFIENLGYEAVLFESGDIPFYYKESLDKSCYAEIENCHMLVLIIGGRYGNPSYDNQTQKKGTEKNYEYYNSITKREYETARDRDIPIFIFVEKSVFAEYHTYKKNRRSKTIKYQFVDNVNIYKLLDEILAQRRNNFVKDFDKFDDIASWLKDQWAGLFANLLSKKSSENAIKSLSAQILSLQDTSKALKSYSESIIRKVQPKDFESIISREDNKIRQSKIRRFEKNDMIGYLLRKGTPKLPVEKLYDAFEKSESLEDFLENTPLKKMFIQKFLIEYKEHAKQKYVILQEEFLEGNESR